MLILHLSEEDQIPLNSIKQYLGGINNNSSNPTILTRFYFPIEEYNIEQLQMLSKYKRNPENSFTMTITSTNENNNDILTFTTTGFSTELFVEENGDDIVTHFCATTDDNVRLGG